MRGFIVRLIPKNPSGVERNKRFLHSNRGKLPMKGEARLLDLGVVECKWNFQSPVPDSVQKKMLQDFTDPLDEAIKREDNITYQVEFIP